MIPKPAHLPLQSSNLQCGVKRCNLGAFVHWHPQWDCLWMVIESPWRLHPQLERTGEACLDQVLWGRLGGRVANTHGYKNKRAESPLRPSSKDSGELRFAAQTVWPRQFWGKHVATISRLHSSHWWGGRMSHKKVATTAWRKKLNKS